MARFVAEMPTGKPDDMVRFIAEDYLNKEGFKQKIYKGEQVWKKGTGMLTAPQFIKFSTYQGNVHLEAWIKQAILPGVYVGEMGLNGAYGFAIKKLLKDRVDALARLLYQPIEAPAPMPVAVPVAAGSVCGAADGIDGGWCIRAAARLSRCGGDSCGYAPLYGAACAADSLGGT